MKNEKADNMKYKKTKKHMMHVLHISLLAICFLHFSGYTAFSTEVPTLEERVTHFIKQFYNENKDVYVKFNNFPDLLKERVKVKHIDFAKIPDPNGDGLCLVEVDGKQRRAKNVYISFKVLNQRKLFAIKQNAKKGDVIRSGDILVKNTYMTGGGTVYPAKVEDIIGKTLKKEIAAGTVITNQMLEDSFAIQKGETVNIMAENKKLTVQAKGKTLEKGRIGDLIRVKNLTSDKEVVGRVIGSSTVKVDL